MPPSALDLLSKLSLAFILLKTCSSISNANHHRYTTIQKVVVCFDTRMIMLILFLCVNEKLFN